MNTKFISPNLHGVFDYVAAVGLILLPHVMGIMQISKLVYWVSICAGIGLIAYSLLTDYVLSIKRIFSFKVHLMLDMLASVTFLLLAVLHEGNLVSQVYCFVMGGGVIAVILFSAPQQRTA